MSSSIDISVLEVLSASDDRTVYIRDSDNTTLQSTFDSWWVSMNTTTKKPVNWNGRKSSPAWRFYKQCGIISDGTPAIICIVCHQILAHPSQVGASGMSKHLTSRVHIAKKNQLTDEDINETGLSVATDEKVLDILKKKGSHGTLMVSKTTSIIFTQSVDFLLDPGISGQERVTNPGVQP